jgi:integrase
LLPVAISCHPPPGFATFCYMASAYTRRGSPYHWLRIRKADGGWKSVSSGIRIGSVGAERKLQQRIAEETAKEERMKDETGVAMMRVWVPKWIQRHYTNEFSRARAFNCWAHLATFFKKKRIEHPEEVNYGVIMDYMAWRTEKERCEKDGRRVGNWNTALTEVRILGSVMHEAFAQGWILANPCARLRLGRRDVKEKREIFPDEQLKIEAALEADEAEEWMKDSWLVGMKHGCRLAEVKVPMERIDVEMMAITFKVKGGRFHTAPLHKDLLPLVARRRSEKAKFLVDLPQNASKRWIQWLSARGHDNLSFHCLRVTVITRFARASVAEAKAMEYVGHCSAMVHAIYRKLRPKDVAELGDFL